MYAIDQIDVDSIQEKLELSPLVDFIIHKDYSWQDGKTCFAIELQEGDTSWELAMALSGDASNDGDWMLTPPKEDKIGKKTIYYWPNVEVRGGYIEDNDMDQE